MNLTQQKDLIEFNSNRNGYKVDLSGEGITLLIKEGIGASIKRVFPVSYMSLTLYTYDGNDLFYKDGQLVQLNNIIADKTSL